MLPTVNNTACTPYRLLAMHRYLHDAMVHEQHRHGRCSENVTTALIVHMQQLRCGLNGDGLGIAKHCASSAQANICVAENTADSAVISASTVFTFLLTIGTCNHQPPGCPPLMLLQPSLLRPLHRQTWYKTLQNVIGKWASCCNRPEKQSQQQSSPRCQR